MPSFFKKLLYGKELSNPYLNRYHPGHNTVPTSQQTQHQQQQPQTFYPTYPQPAAHFPTPLTRVEPRSLTPPLYNDLLGEARLVAGRHPVTGRVANPTEDTNTAANTTANTDTEPNPYLHGGDAAMGRPVARGTVNHAGIFVQEGGPKPGGARMLLKSGEKQAAAAREGNGGETRCGGRRRREMEESGAVAGAGFYGPARPVVREFYGGG
ncbi:hypothetical protein EKO04_007341 [Ascochyta lentis]|uniref:Uncharacterized protein n=1 Tax=Ascochyta lentis TaxID=205686 RepID=A0A8H7MGX6_9PLEO|nr:hypothetical protein EKO04_007341 [Ascochyta lentis]